MACSKRRTWGWPSKDLTQGSCDNSDPWDRSLWDVSPIILLCLVCLHKRPAVVGGGKRPVSSSLEKERPEEVADRGEAPYNMKEWLT
jgi:hypothetical protein